MTEGFFADVGNARNVGDGASIHIAGILVRLADADDVETVVFGLAGDDGFDEFGADVEGENGVVRGLQRSIIISRGGCGRGSIGSVGGFDGFSSGLNFRFG